MIHLLKSKPLSMNAVTAPLTITLMNLTNYPIEFFKSEYLQRHLQTIEKVGAANSFLSFYLIYFNILAKSKIQSCLASFESLDTYLIPSMMSHQNHCTILRMHWQSEINRLQNEIQRIIDTPALCHSFIAQLDCTITDLLRNWNKQLADSIVEKSQILLEHFRINRSDLQLDSSQYYKNYKIIVAECRAAIRDNAAHDRILKRFKIMLNIVKKLKNSIELQTQNSLMVNDKNSKRSEQNHRIVDLTTKSTKQFVVEEEVRVMASNEKYFEHFGISAAASCSIFYQSEIGSSRRKHQGTPTNACLPASINLTPTLMRLKKSMY